MPCEMDGCDLAATITISPGPEFVPVAPPAPPPHSFDLCIRHATLELIGASARAAATAARMGGLTEDEEAAQKQQSYEAATAAAAASRRGWERSAGQAMP